MTKMVRILWHWTAGTHKANSVDKKSYHYIIEGDGTVVTGNHPVSANALGKRLVSGQYAAHTLSLNSGSIGVSLAAMAGAVESPFSTGQYPITAAQVAALVELTEKLGKVYNIPVSPTTMLSHAEVEKTLGVKQKNKWDITYLPGYGKKSPKEIGDILRKMVAARSSVKPSTFLDVPKAIDYVLEAEKPIKQAFSIARWLRRLFGGGK